jgi:hypothetical protein
MLNNSIERTGNFSVHLSIMGVSGMLEGYRGSALRFPPVVEIIFVGENVDEPSESTDC